MTNITRERLGELLSYDPETGVFTRLVHRGSERAGSMAGSPTPDGYLQITVDRRVYRVHRLAWFYMTGEWPKNQIDHIDLNRTNNRWSNLRDATNAQNNANKRIPVTNTTGFKGVRRDRGDKYRAEVRFNGKKISINGLDTPERAAWYAGWLRGVIFKDFARNA